MVGSWLSQMHWVNVPDQCYALWHLGLAGDFEDVSAEGADFCRAEKELEAVLAMGFFERGWHRFAHHCAWRKVGFEPPGKGLKGKFSA